MYLHRENFLTFNLFKNFIMTTYTDKKRVNVISIGMKHLDGTVVQEPGILMRTTRSYAEKLVAQGTHTHTSKSKLRCFLNRDMKLHKNAKILNAIDLKDKKLGHVVFQDPHNGKLYVALKKKEVQTEMQHKKEVDPDTGMLKVFMMMVPHYELRIARFPN